MAANDRSKTFWGIEHTHQTYNVNALCFRWIKENTYFVELNKYSAQTANRNNITEYYIICIKDSVQNANIKSRIAWDK